MSYLPCFLLIGGSGITKLNDYTQFVKKQFVIKETSFVC